MAGPALNLEFDTSPFQRGQTAQNVDVASREIAVVKELRALVSRWRWLSAATVTMPTIGTVNLLDSTKNIVAALAASGWRW